MRQHLWGVVLITWVAGSAGCLIEDANSHEFVRRDSPTPDPNIVSVRIIGAVDTWLEAKWADESDASRCPTRAKPHSLILWNKLGSAQRVLGSEVGPDGSIFGHIIAFAGLQLGSQGSVEFWFQPDWRDSSVEQLIEILRYGVPEDATNEHLSVVFDVRRGRLNSAVWDPSMTASASVQARVDDIDEWTTIEAKHFAITWNGCAPEQTERLMLFINGVALPDIELLGDPRLDHWRPGAELWLLDGVMDSIKIWSYAKTDFSDRFSE